MLNITHNTIILALRTSLATHRVAITCHNDIISDTLTHFASITTTAIICDYSPDKKARDYKPYCDHVESYSVTWSECFSNLCVALLQATSIKLFVVQRMMRPHCLREVIPYRAPYGLMAARLAMLHVRE